MLDSHKYGKMKSYGQIMHSIKVSVASNRNCNKIVPGRKISTLIFSWWLFSLSNVDLLAAEEITNSQIPLSCS